MLRCHAVHALQAIHALHLSDAFRADIDHSISMLPSIKVSHGGMGAHARLMSVPLRTTTGQGGGTDEPGKVLNICCTCRLQAAAAVL